jgi:hypothetical protein
MTQANIILIAMACAALLPAADAPNISGAWAGTWSQDPKTAKDPKLIPPAPGPLVLKAPYSQQYAARQAAEKAAEARGEPLGNTSTMDESRLLKKLLARCDASTWTNRKSR